MSEGGGDPFQFDLALAHNLSGMFREDEWGIRHNHGGQCSTWSVSHALDALRWSRVSLPTGVIVGIVVISKCVQNGDPRMYEWHLTNVKRYKRPRTVKRQPQPVWFRPF